MTPDGTDGGPQIVFGDDGSSGSDVAWLWVNSQQWPEWNLTVVTAEPPPIGTAVRPELSIPHPACGQPPRVTFDHSDFASVEFAVATADPRIVLSSFEHADLLVVGVARGGLGPHHLGSTTEWLLQGVRTPTVVARAGRPVRRVLICADGSSHAASVAEALATMPWIHGLQVDVVAVDDGRTDCTAAVEAIDAILAGTDVERTTTVRQGSPHREILDVAADGSFDLLALGGSGHTTLRRLVLGSTASAVVRLAPCSVLVGRTTTTDVE